MSKSFVFWRASYLQLRVYLWCVLGVTGGSALSVWIQYLAMGKQEDNSSVSLANMMLICLIFVATVLPVSFFKRILNLGATRKMYFNGLLVTFIAWSALFSVVNALWLELEISWIRNYMDTFNILEIFHWDQFGIAGMLVYQFAFYLMFLSLLHLLFSALNRWVGWLMWAVLATAIPVGVSIPSLRVHVADFFGTLLFNDSLLAGFGLNIGLAAVFLIAGWLLTSRRTF